MKGIPIKFRGKDVDTDRYVYGDFVQGDYDFMFINNSNIYRVYPESVAQLIGYDADGNEIYEGDRIIFSGNKLVPFGGKILFEIAKLKTNYPLEKYTKYIPEDDING